MSRGPLVLDIPADLAGHLSVAMIEHRKWATTACVDLPTGWAELQRVLAGRARRGQAGTPLDDLWSVRDGDRVSPRLVTYADAARMLACHERTIKRLVAAGHLTSVRIGTAARLRVTDVDSYIDRLHRKAPQEGRPAC